MNIFKTTMEKKTLVVLGMSILIFGVLFTYGLQIREVGNSMEESNEINSNVFHGPVPEGYDEEHFRKTGITKLIEDID